MTMINWSVSIFIRVAQSIAVFYVAQPENDTTLLVSVATQQVCKNSRALSEKHACVDVKEEKKGLINIRRLL